MEILPLLRTLSLSLIFWQTRTDGDAGSSLRFCGKVIAELKRHHFTRFEEDKGRDMYHCDYSRALQEP